MVVDVERVSGLEKRSYRFVYSDYDHALELHSYQLATLPTERCRKWATIERRDKYPDRQEMGLAGIIVPKDVTTEARETFIRTLRMLPVSA